jgi:opacity protein-like surface antigen
MFHAIDLKKLVLASAVAFCASAPSLSQAFPDLDYGPFHPILGADFQHRNMEFEDGFGDNLWKETYPQVNLYVGMRFGSYFGFVVGHENSKTRSQTVQLSTGERLLGVPLGGTSTFHASSDIKGTYAQIMGYLPLSFLNSTELFLGIGVIHNKLNLEYQFIGDAGGLFEIPDLFDYHETDTHAKVELGIQKIICNHFGLRAVAGWENTSEFNNLRTDQNPSAANSLRQVNLKDTWTVGAGFFWIF